MTHPAWNDVRQLPTLTASSEKYKDLVLNSTTKLQQSLESALSALNLRSMALTKTVNFDSALDDAKAMQQLMPRSALGYLREAIIYSEQGKQRHVIDICNQALRIVDSKDVHYVALQQAKVDAEQRNNKRIDFISELPAEVTTTRLLPMFIDQNFIIMFKPCEYLQVSTVWRDCIVQYLDGLYFSLSEANHAGLWSQVVELAQYTKILHISRYSKGTWLGDLLRNHDFCSLKELYVSKFSSIFIDHFVSSLKSVSSTLTHLNMHIQHGAAFPVAKMISACPNLVSLDVMQPFDANLSTLPMTPCLSLTTLIITFTSEQITFDEIIVIWSRLPSLEHFQLHPCTDIQAALVVTDYYPTMNSMGVTVDALGIDLICKEQCNSGDATGITHLCLDTHESPIDRIINVNPILKRYHNTLEKLELLMDLDTNNGTIYTIQYPRLKKLFLHSSAWWIPSNAPMLQELAMTSDTLNKNLAVLDETPRNLHRLELRDIYAQLRNNVPLASYMMRLARYSQLKELTIDLNTSGNFSTLLDAIGNLQQLQSLMISFKRDWPSFHMEPFFNRLVQGSPCLTSLEMNCDNAPTMYVLNTLKQFEHLQHLGVPIRWTSGNHSFWHWLGNFSQLKSLRIYPLSLDNNPQIQHLKKQRPDITITMDMYIIRPF